MSESIVDRLREHIALFEDKRRSTEFRIEEIVALSLEHGRSLDLEEGGEFDTLMNDLKSIGAHIDRMTRWLSR